MWLRSAAFTVVVPGTVTVLLPSAILGSWPGAPVSPGEPRVWLAGSVIAAGAARQRPSRRWV